MFKPLAVIAMLAFSINPVRADLYLELAAESGGDELISTNRVDSISAGGGVKFALGVQNPLNYDGSRALRLSIGYLSDSISAYNGKADFSTLTFGAMLINSSGPHSFGIGATFHASPEYSDHVDGFRPELIEYDDAAGFVLQYGYHFIPQLEVGVRYTGLTYQTGAIRNDASGVGIYISNGF